MIERISGRAIDLMLAEYCANDRLKVVSKGSRSYETIIESFIRQPGYHDSRLDSTKKITKLGYWIRRNLFRYKKIERIKR